MIKSVENWPGSTCKDPLVGRPRVAESDGEVPRQVGFCPWPATYLLVPPALSGPSQPFLAGNGPSQPAQPTYPAVRLPTNPGSETQSGLGWCARPSCSLHGPLQSDGSPRPCANHIDRLPIAANSESLCHERTMLHSKANHQPGRLPDGLHARLRRSLCLARTPRCPCPLCQRYVPCPTTITGILH